MSAVKGDSIFLVYCSGRDDSTGSRPIKAVHSYDYGQTWNDEVTVIHPFAAPPQPLRVEYCHGVHPVAWASVPDSNHIGQFHIIGCRSADAGRTWSDTIWMSPNSQYWSLDVCLACNHSENQLAVGYMDYRYQVYAFYGDIFASISNDMGVSWPFETQSSIHHTAAWPNLDLVQDTLVAVWSDIQFDIQGMPEIVFNRSNDRGLTWEGEYRLTETPGESGAASISMDDGRIHVVWAEEIPHSYYEIYYKNFTPDSTVSIKEPEIAPPHKLTPSACPNPFNSTLTIIIESDAPGLIDIYDIQGRKVRRLLDGRIEVGKHLITWDGKDDANHELSSGIYFARITQWGVDYLSRSQKLLLVR